MTNEDWVRAGAAAGLVLLLLALYLPAIFYLCAKMTMLGYKRGERQFYAQMFRDARAYAEQSRREEEGEDG